MPSTATKTDEPEPRLRLLNSNDLPAALRLSHQAGWNQTVDDWARLYAWQPNACFVLDMDSEIVATLTTTVYGRDLAWIGMVLVDEAYRRRGFARRLMQHALAWLDANAIATVALDATPVGQLLYTTLGFRDMHAVDRWMGTAPDRRPTGQTVEPTALAPLHLDDLRLDTLAFGADRHAVLHGLTRAAVSGFTVHSANQLGGYVMTRRGATQHFIGPLVARTPEQAEALLDSALASLPTAPAFIDVPRPNETARGLVASRGFTVSRSFTRMARGAALNADLSLVYATAGPEIG